MSMAVVRTRSLSEYTVACKLALAGAEPPTACPVLERADTTPTGAAEVARFVGADCVDFADFVERLDLDAAATLAASTESLGDVGALPAGSWDPTDNPVFPLPVWGGMTRSAVICRRGPFVLPAAFLAAAKRQPLQVSDDCDVELWVEQADATVMTLVPEVYLLPQRALLALARRAGAHAGPTVGVITARSLEGLTLAIAKALLYRETPRQGSLTVLDQPDLRWDGERDRVKAWEDIDAAAARGLSVEAVDVIALGVHGDNIDANLNAAVLCGKVASATKASGSKLAGHTCLSDDLCRRDSSRALVRLPIDQLRCKVVFMESCSGASISDGIFPQELSLALGALEGPPAAYVASTKLVRSTGTGGLAFTALMEAGCSLGEATRLFGAFHRSATGDSPSYLLFGDPELRLPGAGQARRAESLWDRDVPTLTIGLEGGFRAAIVEVCGPRAADSRNAGDTTISLEGAPLGRSGPPILAHVAPALTHDGLTAVVFSPDVVPSGVRIRLARKDPAIPRKLAAELGRNLDFLEYLRAKAAAVDGLRDTPELRLLAADLGEILRSSDALRREAASLSDVDDRIAVAGAASSSVAVESVESGLRNADALLAARWPAWRMPHHFAPFYDGWLSPYGPERSSGECYLCGTETFEVESCAPLRPDVARVITHCARCGLLSDRPAGTPLIQIGGPDTAPVGFAVDLEVRSSGHPRSVHAAALGFESDLPWLQYEVHGSTPLFTITTDRRSKPGIYHLVSLTVDRLGMNVSSRPFGLTGTGAS